MVGISLIVCISQKTRTILASSIDYFIAVKHFSSLKEVWPDDGGDYYVAPSGSSVSENQTVRLP